MRRSRGDIWFVDLTDARGHEQSGMWPAVVLAVAYGGMTIVVPLTTAPAANPVPAVTVASQRLIVGHFSRRRGKGRPPVDIAVGGHILAREAAPGVPPSLRKE